MVILVVFKGFLVVKNLEIFVQIVPEHPIYSYLFNLRFLWNVMAILLSFVDKRTIGPLLLRK